MAPDGYCSCMFGRCSRPRTHGSAITQQAERERDTVLRLSPFFDAEQFATQFGTEAARKDMVAGLREAGFK